LAFQHEGAAVFHGCRRYRFIDSIVSPLAQYGAMAVPEDYKKGVETDSLLFFDMLGDANLLPPQFGVLGIAEGGGGRRDPWCKEISR